MNEITVNKHNFEVAKSQIAQMARNRLEVPKLSCFRTNGGFLGLFSHDVTGDEANRLLVSPLQNSLSSIIAVR